MAVGAGPRRRVRGRCCANSTTRRTAGAPVPRRLRRLAAGGRAHGPRPARLAAADRPGGVAGRRLDGGRVPRLIPSFGARRGERAAGSAAAADAAAEPAEAPAGGRTRWSRPSPPPASAARPAPASACPPSPTRWSRRRSGPNWPARARRWTGSPSTSAAAPAPAPTRSTGTRWPASVRTASHSSDGWTPRTAPAAYGELLADAVRYLDWYPVDGFYLDRAPRPRPRPGRLRPHGGGPARAAAVDARRRARRRARTPTPATPSSPTSSSRSAGRGRTTAGRRPRSGRPTTRPAASSTWCTACPGRTWRRRCGSPAGTAPARCA